MSAKNSMTLRSFLAISAAILPLAPAAAQVRTQSGDRDDEEIVVTADRQDSFSADYVQAGTFRGARQMDTPLTVTVIPEKLLQSQQANGLLDALRNSAGVVASQITPSVYSNLTIRGITVENRGNYRLNGVLPVINLIDMPLENKFRVEAMKGASALYYGFTTPGGIINLTSKRPTEDLRVSAKLAGNRHGQVVVSADVSDTMGNLGYRFNGAIGTQEIGVRRVDGMRYLATAAFDWKATDSLTFNFDAEYIKKSISEPTQIALNTTNTVANGNSAYVFPDLLDPSTNLGDDWLKSASEEVNLLARGRYEFSRNFSLTVDIGQSRLTRTRHYSTFNNYNLVTGDGRVSVTQSNNLIYRNRMVRAELAGRFDTGPIRHNVVLGYSRNVRRANVPVTSNSAATNFLGTVFFAQNYYNPVRLPEQPLPPRLVASYTQIDDTGYYLFETAKIGDVVDLIGGVRKSRYRESNKVTGLNTFSADPTTWTGSVVIKPAKWVSVYGSYIEGLETTPLAPPTANNPFAQLPASPSTQYEAGIKLEPIRSFLVTASYFRIDRTSAAVNPISNVYEFIGEARYEGFEFSAAGEVTKNLSVYLSLLSMKARQQRSATPSIVGKDVENTPRTTASAFVEYKLPFAPGVAVSAGTYFIGRRAVNALNSAYIPGYTLFDLGISYTTEIAGGNFAFRLNAENVGNKRYWAATGSSLLGQGLPSNIKFSIETIF